MILEPHTCALPTKIRGYNCPHKTLYRCNDCNKWWWLKQPNNRSRGWWRTPDGHPWWAWWRHAPADIKQRITDYETKEKTDELAVSFPEAEATVNAWTPPTMSEAQ